MMEFSEMAVSSLMFWILRRTPERTKRQLRRTFLRLAQAFRRMPGARPASMGIRCMFPGTHGWMHRRYTAYAEQAAVMRVQRLVAPSELIPPEEFGPEERIQFLRLQIVLQGDPLTGPRGNARIAD
jgi:hypothetical protein